MKRVIIKRQSGVSRSFVLIGMLFLVGVLALAMNQVQKVQENRSKASENLPVTSPISSIVEPYLYFSSDINNSSTTQPFRVTVKVNSGLRKINGVDIVVNYNPSMLTLMSAEKSDSFVFKNVGGDCVITSTKYDKSLVKGEVKATCYTNDPQATLQIDGSLIDLVFLGKQEGTTNLSFDCTDGETLDSNITALNNKKDIIFCGLNKISVVKITKFPGLFDGILVDDTDYKTLNGQHINLALDKEYAKVISDEKLKLWLSRLDTAYEDYAELTGWKPYGGGKITIQSVNCGDNCYGWAWAGQTISWARQWWQEDELKRINNNNDWSFGILHEISHNFDNYGIWDFDNEMMANFKLAYVAEKENAKVQPDGVYYIGSDIIKAYKGNKDWGYDVILERYKDGKYDELRNSIGNFLNYKLLAIKDNIGGWDTYKQVFRNLSNKGSFGSTNEKVNAFLNEISNVSHKDIWRMFSKDEKAILELKYGDVFPDYNDVNLSDINQDGIVNSIDFSMVKNKVGTNDEKTDLNSDGIVNSLDLNIIKSDLLKVN